MTFRRTDAFSRRRAGAVRLRLSDARSVRTWRSWASDGSVQIPSPFKPGRDERLEVRMGEVTEKMVVKGDDLYAGEVEDMADAVAERRAAACQPGEESRQHRDHRGAARIGANGKASAIVSRSEPAAEPLNEQAGVPPARATVRGMLLAGVLVLAGAMAWKGWAPCCMLVPGETPLKVRVDRAQLVVGVRLR